MTPSKVPNCRADAGVALVVFVVFAYLYLGESIRWNYVASFGCLFAAVLFAFWGNL